MQQRIQYIDLAKGLCILLVVLFHVYQHVHYIPAFIKSLSCFRMPLYFFLSGLFFKEYEGFIGFFLRKVNKLLIPFAFFYLGTSWALSNLLHYAFGGHCSYRVNRFTINPFWQYVCGMTGTLGIILTAKVIKHIPYVTYWGRYSIMILVTHSLLLKIITPLILKLHLPMALTVILVLAVLMFSYQILIPLMKKYLPYVTAQKDVINVSKHVKIM